MLTLEMVMDVEGGGLRFKVEGADADSPEWGAVMAKLCQNERFLNGWSHGSGRKFARPPVRRVTRLTGGLNGLSRDSNPLCASEPAYEPFESRVIGEGW